MSVSITDNSAQLISEVDNKTSLGIRFMLDAIQRISNPKTPMKHGNLRADVIKSVEGKTGYITWDKNYAIYQEKKQFTHYTTSGTGPHFAEDAVKEVVKNGATYFRMAGMK